MGVDIQPDNANQTRRRRTPLDMAVSRVIAKRRSASAYAQQVERLHTVVARTICTTKLLATLPFEEIDMVIISSAPDAKADSAVQRAIAKSRHEKKAVHRTKVA